MIDVDGEDCPRSRSIGDILTRLNGAVLKLRSLVWFKWGGGVAARPSGSARWIRDRTVLDSNRVASSVNLLRKLGDLG